MVQNYSSNPSGMMRLLAASFSTAGTAAEDLATFVDMTPYEWILVTMTLTDVTSVTSATLKFVSSTASAGTSPVTAKDPAGTDILATIGAPAVGDTVALAVRTRGLLQFGSPSITTGGAGAPMVVTVYGVSARDTAELAAGWTQVTTATQTAYSAAVEVANTAIA